MLLLEIFDKPYEWEENKADWNGESDYSYTFDTDKGTTIVVNLTYYKKSEIWDLSFTAKNTKKEQKSSYSLTNEGEAGRIFATVLAILKSEAQKINQLTFTADKADGNRSKVYQKLIQRFGRDNGFEKVDDPSKLKNTGASIHLQNEQEQSQYDVLFLARKKMLKDDD